MKLSECKHGVVVISNFENRIGMVVGISQNSLNEAVPLVQWQDGQVTKTHHAKINPFKD